MSAAALHPNRQTAGILCLVGAVAILTAGDSIVKWLSPSYALHEIMLFRAVFSLMVTAILIWLEGGIRILHTRQPGLHFLRGFLLAIANMFFFLGLATLPFAEVVALFFAAPLFITLLSIPVLGERVGPTRWLAVLTGLIGIVVMLRPGFGMVSIVGVFPLIAAFSYACMQMLTRRLGVTAKAATLSFYIQVVYLLFSAAVGIAVGDGRFDNGSNPTFEFLVRAWTWPAQSDLMLIALCGVLVAFGGYLLSQAYRVAEATAVAPFEYAALPFAVFWGYQLFGDWPDTITLVGSALIVGGGLIVYYRESRRAKLLATQVL
ncbi:MAG: DMT family transporter [Gammaproteobacteria bacterium]